MSLAFSRVTPGMTTAPSIPPQPQQLFGYDLVDLIGEGAGSRIYVASDPATHQIYALKHVIRKEDRDIRFIEQLEVEYEVGRLITHPGLRKTLDLKIEKTLLRKVTGAGLIMEMFDGMPLEQSLPPTMPGVLEVAILTAQALDALHVMGYVHCDLKPSNILVDSRGRVKVIDLGQAARIGSVKERIQGTPDYIAPEQVKRGPVTQRTDIFNFGATFFWALTNQKLPTLFTLKKGDNSFLVHDKLQTPQDIRKEIPETLSNLIMECVHVNPAKRPDSMSIVARRLEVIHHVMTTGSGAR